MRQPLRGRISVGQVMLVEARVTSIESDGDVRMDILDGHLPPIANHYFSAIEHLRVCPPTCVECGYDIDGTGGVWKCPNCGYKHLRVCPPTCVECGYDMDGTGGVWKCPNCGYVSGHS